MTLPHPVHFRIETQARHERIHVLIRLALLLAIGTLGYSSIYWLLYLGLPALVALSVIQRGGERYLHETAPRIVRVLRWLAGAYAYLWLLTDVLPTTESSGPVELEVRLAASSVPTAGSALARLVTSLPALVLAAVLSLAGSLLWLVAAIFILVNEHMPVAIADFLAMALRYQARLVAYHLSLSDRYPSVGESPAVHAPA